MARCIICNRWRFSFKLQEGMCTNCSAKAVAAAQQAKDCTQTAADTEPAIQDQLSNQRTTFTEPDTPPAPKRKEPKKYRVTGISHYEDNLMTLAIEDDSYSLTKRELIDIGLTGERVWKYFFSATKVDLVPEPDNPADPKAIRVIVDGMHVGYIKAGSCAHLHKVIRENRIKSIHCEIFGGPYKFVGEDYDYERDKEVYTMDKGNAPYAVHLTIDVE